MDGLDSGGLPAMRRTHSGAAEYAGFRLGEGLVSEDTKKELKRALQGIQDGSFARDWILENLAGFPCLAASRGREAAHPAMTTGSALDLAESTRTTERRNDMARKLRIFDTPCAMANKPPAVP
jgi:ketol-acid reductoisomerase